MPALNQSVTKHLTLLLFIGLIFWSCEDNDSANNQSCCNSGCIDESKISNDYNCDDYYEPVCGCNGITYGNECYAENAGVTEWTEGK